MKRFSYDSSGQYSYESEGYALSGRFLSNKAAQVDFTDCDGTTYIAEVPPRYIKRFNCGKTSWKEISLLIKRASEAHRENEWGNRVDIS